MAGSPAGASPSSSSGDFLVALTGITPALAVYLYFLGVSYAYYLFSHFGLSLNSVDIPIYYFFVFSYGAIINFSGWNILLWSLLLGLCASALLFDLKDSRLRILLLVVVLALFPISAQVSATYAQQQAREQIENPSRIVHFIFKGTPSYDLNKDNDEGNLVLLFDTSDKVVAFRARRDESALMQVYIVPLSEVSEVRIRLQE